MATRAPAKKEKRSLAAIRKRQEEKLLSMSEADVVREMQGTFDKVLSIVKKRS